MRGVFMRACILVCDGCVLEHLFVNNGCVLITTALKAAKSTVLGTTTAAV